MIAPRRLLVVEDESLIASLLAQALTGAGFEVQTASDVLQARAAIRAFDPDAVLLDIDLGDGPNGLDLAHILRSQRPDIAVVILTKYPDPRTAGVGFDNLPPGCGFLRKDFVKNTEYLLSAINDVLLDHSHSVRHDLLSEKSFSQLTSIQLEVLRFIATGYTNEHICQLTGASQSTVERWVTELFRALGIDKGGIVNSRVEAARQFIAIAGIPERL